MIRTYMALIALIVIVPFNPAEARPVSYPGGMTAITTNNGDKNSLLLHYSPTAKTAIGYKMEYWRKGEYTINAVQANHLVQRWNKPGSQANLYVKGGAGIASDKFQDFSGNIDPAGFIGLATDWEDRRFFVSYENRYTDAGDYGDGFRQAARIGFAPYEGDYGDLHTWLIVEVEHAPEETDEVTVTPLVRFFKDVHLMEAGMRDDGSVLFNWIYRY